MAETSVEVAVKTRIESLNHTRQLIVVLGTIFTGLYAIAGKEFIVKVIDGQCILKNWGNLPLNSYAFLIATSLLLSDVCFILAVFLLTDSIHNYSKVLEYSCKELFDDSKENKTALSHNRALVADDLSYFGVRVGTLLLIFSLLMALSTVTFGTCRNHACAWVILFAIIGLILSVISVTYSYHVSHCKKDPNSKLVKKERINQFLDDFMKFGNFKRWKKAWCGNGTIHKNQDDGKQNSTNKSSSDGN